MLFLFIVTLLFIPDIYFSIRLLMIGLLIYAITAILPLFFRNNKIINFLNKKIL
jgi:hypothetical protein